MFNSDLVSAKLVALGDTADAVAESLTRLGIKGTPGDSCECPLSHYAVQHCGLPPQSVVDMSQAGTTLYHPAEGKTVLDTPPACGSFITFFDNLHYPDLIDPDRPIII